ncbi:glycosyltransferase [Pedobacter agri]|uniref:glycosyltransferase n=1 Tax=Pedobacter agri TaxID=454586 RepID=UPI00277FB4F0|nr:glycosyltransferase [Pedobacter agri]MDQ1141122.1 glycosyltransferase involved in cell wall biosynthesis [Pedobacter agri]
MIKKEGITVHTLVRNEEKWIWFSIMSVIEFVEKIIIYDTGSTDNTAAIIDEIKSSHKFGHKIHFEKKSAVTKEEFTLLRQDQITKTDTNWFLVLDGDEIWYEKDLRNLVSISKTTSATMLAIRFHNCTKDVYHYESYDVGGYVIKGEKGHITLKLIKMSIPGIHADGPYGMEGYFNEENQPIQNSLNDIDVVDGFFLHTSNLIRSRNLFHDWKIPYRRAKVFSTANKKVDSSFEFPEVFYINRPSNITNPLRKAGIDYYFFKLLTKPVNLLRFFKQKLA